MEGVRCARAMRRGAGQRIDDLRLLDDRAGSPVRDNERQRVVMVRTNVNELRDLRRARLGGVALAVEDDEAPDPRDTGLLGPEAQVAGAQGLTAAVEEAELRGPGWAALPERPRRAAPPARRPAASDTGLEDVAPGRTYPVCPGPCQPAAWGISPRFRKSPIGYAGRRVRPRRAGRGAAPSPLAGLDICYPPAG